MLRRAAAVSAVQRRKTDQRTREMTARSTMGPKEPGSARGGGTEDEDEDEEEEGDEEREEEADDVGRTEEGEDGRDSGSGVTMGSDQGEVARSVRRDSIRWAMRLRIWA
jgi:hypothetical protein